VAHLAAGGLYHELKSYINTAIKRKKPGRKSFPVRLFYG